MAATDPNFRLEEINPQSKVVFSFVSGPLRNLDITERVRRSLPLFKWCLALHPLSLPSRSEILPCLMPKSSQTSQAVSSTVSALVSSVVTVTTSTSSSVLAFPLVSKSTVPLLIHQRCIFLIGFWSGKIVANLTSKMSLLRPPGTLEWTLTSRRRMRSRSWGRSSRGRRECCGTILLQQTILGS